MSDEQRLAEIEASVPRWGMEEDGTISTAGVIRLRPADFDWLIARIHALKAQAAKVGLAAAEFLDAHDAAGSAFVLRREYGKDWTPELVRQANARDTLKDTLKAREESDFDKRFGTPAKLVKGVAE